jgi:hypothetical protein
MNNTVGLSLLCAFLLVTAPTFPADIVVNGIPLEETPRRSLEQKYGVPIKPGRYWYDNISSVWGALVWIYLVLRGLIEEGLALRAVSKRSASETLSMFSRERHERALTRFLWRV